jgi:hypothetical protein
MDIQLAAPSLIINLRLKPTGQYAQWLRGYNWPTPMALASAHEQALSNADQSSFHYIAHIAEPQAATPLHLPSLP